MSLSALNSSGSRQRSIDDLVEPVFSPVFMINDLMINGKSTDGELDGSSLGWLEGYIDGLIDTLG